jgi:hypothetical protein
MLVDEIWKTKLPNLALAMEQTSEIGLGMCFYRAAALVLDLPGSEMLFGTFDGAPADEVAKDPRHSPVPFIHSWVEWHGQALAPTLFERDRPPFMMDRAGYYRANNARNLHRLTRVAVRRVAAASGFHDWLQGKPIMGIPTALLAAAGVKWRADPGGGVLPLEPDIGGLLRHARKP